MELQHNKAGDAHFLYKKISSGSPCFTKLIIQHIVKDLSEKLLIKQCQCQAFKPFHPKHFYDRAMTQKLSLDDFPF